MESLRRRESLLLATNPIVFSLAQIVISPVLRMESYLAEIQERLRRAGFPRFATAAVQQFQLKPGGAPDVTTDTRWVFADRANQTAVVLSTNFVVVEQTAYKSFDETSETVARVTEIIEEVVAPELAERLGFRRVNLIDADKSGLSLQDFFQPGLRGLNPNALELDQLDARLEESGQTPVGRLVVRLSKPAPAAGLPHDLLGTTLEHPPAPSHAEHALLDIDHFAGSQIEFSTDEIISAFWALHEYSDLAFRSAVTAEALEYWRRGRQE